MLSFLERVSIEITAQVGLVPARNPLRPIKRTSIDGFDCALATLPDGRLVMMDWQSWEWLQTLGYSPNICLMRNGHGGAYPKIRANLPPDGPIWRHHTHTVARLIVGMAMLLDEVLGGPKAILEGWHVEPINHDPLDLRLRNLRMKVTKGRPSKSHAQLDLRLRAEWVHRGINPEVAYRAIWAVNRDDFAATTMCAITTPNGRRKYHDALR